MPSVERIQFRDYGFPRTQYGAGLIKPGAIIMVKVLLIKYVG
jgi:hypothetical protein